MHRRRTIAAVAFAAAAAAAQLAAADGAGAPRAAAAQGGLSVTPSILETTARSGASASTTVTNTTARTLRVTVKPRPWRQARSGAVAADRTRRLRGVALSTRRFTLAPGARRDVYVTMGRVPAGGSRFGALDVVGRPAPRRTGVNVAYRLVPSLRFNPARAARRYAVRAGAARVAGRAGARTLKLLVRNAGNTVDPVGGSVRITGGGGGRSGTIAAVRILPGRLVALRLASLAGLRRGAYTARVTLTQGGRPRRTVGKAFRIR